MFIMKKIFIEDIFEGYTPAEELVTLVLAALL
jgi:hypothetical protein